LLLLLLGCPERRRPEPRGGGSRLPEGRGSAEHRRGGGRGRLPEPPAGRRPEAAEPGRGRGRGRRLPEPAEGGGGGRAEGGRRRRLSEHAAFESTI
jgi:hypothetical protein